MTQPDSPHSPTQKYRLTAKGVVLAKQQKANQSATQDIRAASKGWGKTRKLTQESTQESTQKIIVAIANNPNVTRQELSDIVGITQDGIKKALDGLKRKGLIRRVGPDKGGHWEIVKR